MFFAPPSLGLERLLFPRVTGIFGACEKARKLVAASPGAWRKHLLTLQGELLLTIFTGPPPRY